MKSLYVEEDLTDSFVIVDNCQFIDNERAMTVVGYFTNLTVRDCLFSGNIAVHAGAALLVLTNNSSQMLIVNGSFENNAAGRFRSPSSSGNDPSTEGSEIHLQSVCCKGSIEMVGKGGAVRVQGGTLNLKDSRFVNNTASLLGGALFVDSNGTVILLNTSFENGVQNHDRSVQGDILYSDGRLEIDHVSFIVRDAVNWNAVVRHSGMRWSMKVSNFQIDCPMGYSLRVTNSSAYRVTPAGLESSNALDELSFFCEACPLNKYSLDHGHLQYRAVALGWYYTLFINGSSPDPDQAGEHIHHSIQCEDCPYGGKCVEGITSVPNYWGYEVNSAIYFQRCPRGYCCLASCKSFDSCSGHRQGRLCGRCSTGFSEAISSPNCLPDSVCRLNWMLPVAVIGGFVYALLVTFLLDVLEFTFGLPCITCNTSSKCTTNNCNMKTNERILYRGPSIRSTEGRRSKTDQLELCELLENKRVETVTDSSETITDPAIPPGNTDVRLHGEPMRRQYESTSRNEHGRGRDLNDNSQSPTCIALSCTIIFISYYQDAALLTKDFDLVSKGIADSTAFGSYSRAVLSWLLSAESFRLVGNECALAGTTAVTKTMMNAIYTVCILATVVAACLLVRALRRMRNRSMDRGVSLIVVGTMSHVNSRFVSSSAATTDILHQATTTVGEVSNNTLIALILAVLCMYQRLSSAAFTLLHCVSLDDASYVMYIDGTIACYQPWQYAVLFYVACCVVLLPLVLAVGPGLLEQGYISLPSFFLALFFPPPFLVSWFVRWHYNSFELGAYGLRTQDSYSYQINAVLDVFIRPFHQTRKGTLWIAILVSGRLLLVLLATFVDDPLLKFITMLSVCFLVLYHIDGQPFRSSAANFAGTAAACSLIVLATSCLVRATFEAAEYEPIGPNAALLGIFDRIEDVLMIWLPLMVITMTVLRGLWRLVSKMTRTFMNM